MARPPCPGLPELCDDARSNIYSHLYKHGKCKLRHLNADELIDEYLAFMDLKGKHNAPKPSNAIDEVWHAHIVDTKNYRLFCNKYFGEFIDRDPGRDRDQGRVMDSLVRAIKDELNTSRWPFMTGYKSNMDTNDGVMKNAKVIREELERVQCMVDSFSKRLGDIEKNMAT